MGTPSRVASRFGDEERIIGIKVISGWCIEHRRRLDGMGQKKLAKMAGVGIRWMREIEAGSPKAKIDDHLRCASALGLSIGYILIPMLYDAHGRIFPRNLLLYDLGMLEERCVDAIASAPLDVLVRQPTWQ